MYSLCWYIGFMSVVFPLGVTAQNNSTPAAAGLHIAVQVSDNEVTGLWTQHIVSHINRLKIVQNYTIVADLLDSPSDSYYDVKAMGKMILDATSYFGKNKAYCFVGNSYSEHTMVTASITSALNVVQISPRSTAEPLFDKNRYPYFLSTNQKKQSQVNMVNAILLKYNWEKIAVITENVEPMIGVFNDLLDVLLKSNRSAEITATFSNRKDLDNVIQRIKLSGVKIIIAISYQWTAKEVMCKAYEEGLTGKRYVWFTSYVGPAPLQKWWSSPDPDVVCKDDEVNKAFENQFVINTDYVNAGKEQQTVLGQSTASMLESFSKEVNKTLSPFQTGFLFGRLADALLTCAMALDATQKELSPRKLEDVFNDDGKDVAITMYRKCREQKFQGLSGSVSFSEQGDRHSTFAVYQIKGASPFGPIVGYTEADDKVEYFETDDIIWKHVGGVPRRDEDTVITNTLPISNNLFYTYIALTALNVVLVIVLILVQILFRKRSAIKYSWPLLNEVIGVGCIAICAVVILKGLDASRVTKDELLTICMVSNWLLVIGFTLTVGAMLTKMWAIYSFFHREAKGKKTINECANLAILVVMVIIDVIIMLVWGIVDPLKVNGDLVDESYNEDKQEVYQDFIYSCSSENSTYWMIGLFCYKGIGMILAGFMTWPAWIISSKQNISDSHYLGIAVYGCILSCVICVPVSFLIQKDPSLQYGIVSGVMLASVLLTVCLLLIPKVISLRQNSDERIAKINSPIGALFGFMSTLADSGALPGAGIERAKDLFAVNMVMNMAMDQKEEEGDN